MREKSPIVIAVCGKGGVGKTSISVLIVRALRRLPGNPRVLAIDADPAVGFATALGIDVGRTVDDIRLEVIEASKNGNGGEVSQIIQELDYELTNAIVENGQIAFLAIGRPETEGCYCKVNEYLRMIIESLAGNFDYVVIDGEAGIEQINRRVMEQVTHLLLVSDCSKKGLNVITTLRRVAENVMKFEAVGAILNRLRSPDEARKAELNGIPLLGAILEDLQLRQYDIDGASLLQFPDNATTGELERALHAFNVM
jgi:CO dehydrogenase maturation factor